MFVDWLNVSQFHGEGTPELVAGFTFKLSDDGDADVETGHAKAIRGSFDTTLRVRSHGGWVHVSGNPSRFNRKDNLFGFDLDEAMSRVNHQLLLLGLPQFTRGHPVDQSAEPTEHGLLPRWTGAAFSRIDVTRNYEAGSEFLARLAIRAYQGMSKARTRRGSYGDETCMWITQRRTVKVYRKGVEMALHAKDSPWVDWAREKGIVRHEVELRSKLLSDTRLRYWGNLTMGKLIELHQRETAFLGRVDASLDPVAVEHVPAKSRLVYAAWLKGQDVRELLPRATFYRHKAVLLKATGCDVSDRRDITLPVPIVREVALVPAVEPQGYWQEAA